MRLAIVDPQPVAGEVLAFAAKRRGHQVLCLADVSRLFGRLPFEPAAIIVWLDGRDDRASALIERLRQRFPEQLLMITAERPADTFVTGALHAGADDVVRVPYHPSEAILKAEAAVARQHRATDANTVEVGDLQVDLDRYAATKAGESLTLTKLELRLLYCLCEHSPHLAPLDRLLTFGWDGGDPEPSLIKTHMSHLRKKLRAAGGLPLEISSRQTLGYAISRAAVDARLSEKRAMVQVRRTGQVPA